MLSPMAGRYNSKPPPLNFGPSGAFGSEPAKARKPSPLEDFLRLGAGVAPALGGVAGGLLGTFAAPGLGTAAGAGLGAAAGGALGAGLNFGAEQMAGPDERAEIERQNREMERQARAQAALSLLR